MPTASTPQNKWQSTFCSPLLELRTLRTRVSKWHIQDSHPSQPIQAPIPLACPQSTQSTVNQDESGRISLQHSNCHPTPYSSGLEPCGHSTLKQPPNQTLSVVKQKTRKRALQLLILLSQPEEYFHDLSLWMNSGREEHNIM